MLETAFLWKSYFAGMPLDVRMSGNARWIDQKCTPDVLSAIADCIVQYQGKHNAALLRSVDVWQSDYAMQYIPTAFKKPRLDDKNARHEYDKLFQQPMELLAYAGILSKVKDGNRNYYSVSNPEALEYISFRERNALDFLVAYVEAVIEQSGLKGSFEAFFSAPAPDTYHALKDAFTAFTTTHTPVNGKTECWRMFPKVLNPIAFARHRPGSERGRISRGVITYDMLMYNRDNFRDVLANKPKGVPRSAWAVQNKWKPNAAYAAYVSQRAKREMRAFNDRYRGGRSELSEGAFTEGQATQVHHIFPISTHPTIAGRLENLIVLTPNQHFLGAHPHGDTSRVDPDYQYLCLKAKTESIEDNLSGEQVPVIYSFDGFLEVLNTGLNDGEFLAIESGDFDHVVRETRAHYGR